MPFPTNRRMPAIGRVYGESMPSEIAKMINRLRVALAAAEQEQGQTVVQLPLPQLIETLKEIDQRLTTLETIAKALVQLQP